MEYTTYKDYWYVNLVDFSDDELIELRNNLDIEYGKLAEEWGEAVAHLVNDLKVDPYTFWGGRKVKKVTKKYSSQTAEIQVLIEDIHKELQKRDNYRFEQSFIGGKPYHDMNLSEKEFFEKEQLKTLKYKESIDVERPDEEDEDNLM